MITINYRGRYGNNLFQLSAANLLSKKYNKIIISKPRSNIMKLHKTSSYIDLIKEEVIVNNKNFMEMYNNPHLNDCNIVLDGFFQRKEIISKFIQHNEYFTGGELPKEKTFVHVRLGDFIKNKMALDYRYYETALYKVNTDNLVLSTDDENHDIVKKILDKYNATLIQESPENTILYGSSCKNKVLSLGTFSWWIGFLGNILHSNFVETTICPNINNHVCWHGKIFPMFDWVEL